MAQSVASLKAKALVSRNQMLPSSEFGVAFLPGTDSTYPRMSTTELLQAYSRMPWLRAVVDKVSSAVGATSWRLWVLRNSDGRAVKSLKMQNAPRDLRRSMIKKAMRRGDLEEIDTHPILDLLSNGNDRFIGPTVFKVTQQHLDIVGEGFWALEMNSSGVPVSIWPLPPDWIKRFPSQEDPNWIVNIKGFEYKLDPDMVISFIDPDPSDPYNRGSGIARALSDELETDEYAAKHLKSYFINRARPDLIISGEGLGRQDTARLEERWNQQHRGFWNAFKPHFINRKIEVKEVGQNFREMQLGDLRKQERDTILQVYGVSPEKFGILNQSNRSTIVAADLFWTKDVITPRVDLFRNIMQAKLVPMYDDRIILDYESPIIEDAQNTRAVMAAMPAAFTINEWREEANKPPLPDDVGSLHIVRPGEEIVPEDELEEVGEDLAGTPASPTAPDDEGENEAIVDRVVGHLASLLAKSISQA